MKKFLKVFLFLVCFFSLLISFSQFQKTTLSTVQWSGWKWFDQEQDRLSVSFRIYSKNECKELLSKDLVSRGYQPIQIDIVNPTPDEYEISPADVSLPSEKPSKMALKVMKSALPRSLLFKAAGLVFWPVNIIGLVDSLNAFKSFDEMRTDWQAMTIQPNEKVPPFSTLHRVVFVQEDHLTGTFMIQLKNSKSGEYQTFESNASLQHIVQMLKDGVKLEEGESSDQLVPTTPDEGLATDLSVQSESNTLENSQS